MKSRLSTIVSGEYIKSPMINFISEAAVEQHENLVNSIFRGKGIISSYDMAGNYDNSLEVVAGENNNIIVYAGAFVSPTGKLVSVPYTETSFPSQRNTRIFIRYKESYFIPDVTISGEKGNLDVTYSSQSILNYIQNGMGILTETMYKQKASPLEITGIGTTISVSEPLSTSFSNERVIIVPKFVTGLNINTDTSLLYRFDDYEIIDEASLNSTASVPSDAILLAQISNIGGVYQINNIRVSTNEEIDDTKTNVEWLPNVTSLSTSFSDAVQYAIRRFFTEGILQIGTEEKDLWNFAHQQNTDSGTSNSYFDINTKAGILRLGDSNQSDYLIRLFSNVTSKRSYELPSGILTDDSANSTLVATNISQQLTATFGVTPFDVRISGTTLTLPSKSTIFNVSGGGELKTIQFEGAASNFVGQILIVRFSTKTTILSGGNIISRLISDRTNQTNSFVVESDEAIVLVNIGFSWYIISTGMSEYARYLSLLSSISDLKTLLTNSISGFTSADENLKSLIVTNTENITKNTTNLEDLKKIVVEQGVNVSKNTASLATIQSSISTLNSKAEQLDNRVTILEKKVSSISQLPKGAIVAFNLSDTEITENFSSTGVGNQSGAYYGWHICNGFDNTPNIQGRSLIMANSFTGQNSSFPTGTAGNKTWPSIQPGSNVNGITNPTLPLSSGTDRMLGAYSFKLTFRQMPAHRHVYVAMNPGDFDGYSFPYTDSGGTQRTFRQSIINQYTSGSYGDNASGRRFTQSFTSTDGGNGSNDNDGVYFMPPSYIVIYLIKTI